MLNLRSSIVGACAFGALFFCLLINEIGLRLHLQFFNTGLWFWIMLLTPASIIIGAALLEICRELRIKSKKGRRYTKLNPAKMSFWLTHGLTSQPS
ncbi:MAG: hypothetical protein ACP5SH_03555 [Syntrophobacteraceae bacterium]